MALGLVGKKVGMTRVFSDEGVSIPVTVVQVEPNRVTQVKQEASDGYVALQLTTGVRRANRVTKPLRGHFAKAGTEAGRKLWEVRVDAETAEQYPAGSELTVEILQQGQKVDVRGTTIGRGFAGVMRRHGFGGGRATHGNSKAHRKPGSIGQNQDPGRVFKGKKMAGHMGNVMRVQQNLEIVRIDAERNLVLIRGSVPGPRGFDLLIEPSVKARGDNAAAADAG
ncbi:MAG: 50S ribosomal protein L3 [Acidiferrobacteraceae bacterium]|jgi:large subunit ribosomal protein L3|nr:50S ribosomal protein L3 [Acidiferrobacteraceae bacterium]MDP6399221.1 50S ribosomal protein L3 [Arenicellales bacterium]MDP6551056.1 50S ribosomal protein L3 [Arenicellales bacterium]MDP6790910.1 50S ribosomal protein L3 [Arenicellales bacterium]MDP6918821.1 50S ribosomal protein L3 [Arenicellales bacterium]|tara:strand:- start:44452 stop:45123 length:672 start_codon:yes stop_codon:yes gene_type:complete